MTILATTDPTTLGEPRGSELAIIIVILLLCLVTFVSICFTGILLYLVYKLMNWAALPNLLIIYSLCLSFICNN
jgi:hypothetical protein